MRLPTVKIEDDSGDYIVINETDFDAKKHKPFVEKEEKPKEAKKPKSAK